MIVAQTRIKRRWAADTLVTIASLDSHRNLFNVLGAAKEAKLSGSAPPYLQQLRLDGERLRPNLYRCRRNHHLPCDLQHPDAWIAGV